MFALLLILTGCQLLWSSPAESTSINEPVPILKSVAEQLTSGSYLFSYETADGTYREELGIVSRSSDSKSSDDELEVSGIYRYIDDWGQEVEVRYTADKSGFLPHVRYISKGKPINHFA
ncbi:larval cuticle protein 1 [Drosophila santomea]|uniref:larval cuticle protein 1 n=1 Tax=Drosophila santomea TaxID=129105 RepID=UPI001CCDB7BB|nr:larval cuticle protein 1 [Drosophila santomea]